MDSESLNHPNCVTRSMLETGKDSCVKKYSKSEGCEQKGEFVKKQRGSKRKKNLQADQEQEVKKVKRFSGNEQGTQLKNTGSDRQDENLSETKLIKKEKRKRQTSQQSAEKTEALQKNIGQGKSKLKCDLGKVKTDKKPKKEKQKKSSAPVKEPEYLEHLQTEAAREPNIKKEISSKGRLAGDSITTLPNRNKRTDKKKKKGKTSEKQKTNSEESSIGDTQSDSSTYYNPYDEEKLSRARKWLKRETVSGRLLYLGSDLLRGMTEDISAMPNVWEGDSSFGPNQRDFPMPEYRLCHTSIEYYDAEPSSDGKEADTYSNASSQGELSGSNITTGCPNLLSSYLPQTAADSTRNANNISSEVQQDTPIERKIPKTVRSSKGDKKHLKQPATGDEGFLNNHDLFVIDRQPNHALASLSILPPEVHNINNNRQHSIGIASNISEMPPPNSNNTNSEVQQDTPIESKKDKTVQSKKGDKKRLKPPAIGDEGFLNNHDLFVIDRQSNHALTSLSVVPPEVHNVNNNRQDSIGITSNISEIPPPNSNNTSSEVQQDTPIEREETETVRSKKGDKKHLKPPAIGDEVFINNHDLFVIDRQPNHALANLSILPPEVHNVNNNRQDSIGIASNISEIPPPNSYNINSEVQQDTPIERKETETVRSNNGDKKHLKQPATGDEGFLNNLDLFVIDKQSNHALTSSSILPPGVHNVNNNRQDSVCISSNISKTPTNLRTNVSSQQHEEIIYVSDEDNDISAPILLSDDPCVLSTHQILDGDESTNVECMSFVKPANRPMLKSIDHNLSDDFDLFEGPQSNDANVSNSIRQQSSNLKKRESVLFNKSRESIEKEITFWKAHSDLLLKMKKTRLEVQSADRLYASGKEIALANLIMETAQSDIDRFTTSMKEQGRTKYRNRYGSKFPFYNQLPELQAMKFEGCQNIVRKYKRVKEFFGELKKFYRDTEQKHLELIQPLECKNMQKLHVQQPSETEKKDCISKIQTVSGNGEQGIGLSSKKSKARAKKWKKGRKQRLSDPDKISKEILFWEKAEEMSRELRKASSKFKIRMSKFNRSRGRGHNVESTCSDFLKQRQSYLHAFAERLRAKRRESLEFGYRIRRPTKEKWSKSKIEKFVRNRSLNCIEQRLNSFKRVFIEKVKNAGHDHILDTDSNQ